MTRISGFGEVELAAHQAKVRTTVMNPINAAAPPKKRSKYGGQKVYIDRIWFASKAEAKRYDELCILQAVSLISGLVVHPAFPLEVDGKQIGTYRADFRYLQNGVEIVEDVKSTATAKKETFMRTKKHVLAQYGIDIQVVM